MSVFKAVNDCFSAIFNTVGSVANTINTGSEIADTFCNSHKQMARDNAIVRVGLHKTGLKSVVQSAVADQLELEIKASEKINNLRQISGNPDLGNAEVNAILSQLNPTGE